MVLALIECKRSQLSRYDDDKILITNIPQDLVDEISKMFRFDFKVGNKFYNCYVHQIRKNEIIVKKYWHRCRTVVIFSYKAKEAKGEATWK